MMRFKSARSRIAAVSCACAGVLALGAIADASLSAGAATHRVRAASSSTSAFPAAVTANNAYSKRPTSIGITTPVGKPIPKGKVIDFIQCGVPACAVEGDIIEDATNLLHWKFVRINAGVTPQTIADAYQQAVTNKPSAVLGSGYPRVLYNKQITALNAEHVPVVESFTEDTAGGGLIGLVGTKVTTQIQGKEVADYILAHSTNTSMTIGSVVPTGFPTMIVTTQSLTSTVKQICAKCSVKVLSVPNTSIGSDLPTRIASFLTANPNITWMDDGYDDMVTGVPTALKGASISGAKLTTVSMNGSIAPYISGHQYLQAAIGTSFPEAYWREVDLLARYFTGQSFKVDTNDATLPYWTITSANIPSNASSVTFANVVDYKQQFEKLWGIG